MRRGFRPSGFWRGLPHAHAWLWLLCALAFASPALGQGRAWLDRDRVDFGQSVMLNIEVDTTQSSGMPDMRALERDFTIVGRSMRQDLNLGNGDVALRITLQIVLQPLRSGEIEIPMLRIGSSASPPLRLTVLPPRGPPPPEAPPPKVVGTPLFIEARVDNETPYVQQTLGYTVRLYYISGIVVDGRIDQDPPEGASLQKIGDDLQLSQRLGNDEYSIIERRFLLIPERSGTVSIPPARFQGRTLSLFESIFDGPRDEARVRSGQTELRVKPIPAAAPQPWLPLRGLTLRYLEAPQSLRAGESATITVEAVADGATTAQLPALEMTAGDGAQVFAEPAQMREDFVGGRPQARVVRRFSVLPARDGMLRIAGPRVSWWDTEAEVARVASLPDLILPVAPGLADAGVPNDRGTAGDGDADTAGRWTQSQTVWRWAALPLLALLWVLALSLAWRLWTVRKQRVPAGPAQPAHDHRNPTPLPSSGTSASMSSSRPASPPPDGQTLAATLARGDLGEIVRVLCATAKVGDLDAVRVRLDDAGQRAAVDVLQRARWGDGDAAAALPLLRRAFASGPRWRADDTVRAQTILPPLYPEG